MHVKLRGNVMGDGRIRETVFVGPSPHVLQNAGTLVLNVGEWQLFGAALMLGAGRTNGDLAVESNDDEVIAALNEQQRPWSEWPVGTVARDTTGAAWVRVADGWKARGGDTFPTPGAGARVRRP